MSVFEKYLTLWGALGIVAGIALGQVLPGAFAAIGGLEVANVNFPLAVLIWPMIIPMLLKIDFAALKQVTQRWRGDRTRHRGGSAGRGAGDAVGDAVGGRDRQRPRGCYERGAAVQRVAARQARGGGLGRGETGMIRRILFLCVANSARSQMAEGLARAPAPCG